MAASGRKIRPSVMVILCLMCFLAFPAVICFPTPPNASDEQSDAAAIAIDFGAMFNRVAVLQESEIKILPPEQTSQFSPAYIAFTKDGILFGEAAERHAAIDPYNTVFGLRSLIGRNFTDIQGEVEHLPFQVVSKDNWPVIQVDVAGKTMQYTPEQLCSMMLDEMKETAGSYLGSAVGNAIITIPTSFGEEQRDALKRAAQDAGLYVPRLIREPTAAGIAHHIEDFYDERVLLVVDVGEYLSAHVLVVEQGVYELLATVNEVPLAARDCTPHSQNCLDHSYTSNPNLDVMGYSQAFFSNESLIAQSLEGSIKSVEKVLKEARLTRDQISDLVLVGGSTYIPQFQAQFERYLGLKASNLTKAVDAIVVGAAVQAQVIFYDDTEDYGAFAIEILPLSLGIETVGGVMAKMIPRHTMLPRINKQNFTTAVDNQTTVMIKLFEGERAMTRDNGFLTQFELSIPPSPSGVASIEVCLTVDFDYVITVAARSLLSGEERTTQFKIDLWESYNADRMDFMISQAEEYAESDAVLRQLLPETRALEGRRSTDDWMGEASN